MSGQAKSLRLQFKAASGEPTAEQLAAIRTYTLREFPVSEIVVREFVLAHNGIDRDAEVFDEPLLADFARTLPGKGTFVRHPGGWDGDSGPPEGRVFAARVERMSFDEARTLLREPALQFPPDRAEAAVLMASAYFVRTGGNADLLTQMDAGIASDVSIGFAAKRGADPIRDASGRELQARRWVAPGEAMEMSIVWLGAQPGARAVKAAKPEEETMTPEEKAAFEAAQQKAAAAESRAAELAKSAEQLDALRKSLGTDAALIDSPQSLASLIHSGKSHRNALIDGIVAGERHAGITGDSEAEVKAARDLYESLPTDRLVAMAKRYEQPATAPQGKGGLTPSNPGTPAPGAGTKGAGDSLINNPAFG